MKTSLIVLVVVVALGGIYFATKARPDATVPEAVVENSSNAAGSSDLTSGETQSGNLFNNEAVTVAFKGFGPDKEHSGTVSGVNSNLSYDGTNVSGDIVVDLNTLTSDNEKLTTHLKSADFFDTAAFPTAKFVVSSFDGTNLTGVMTVKGIAKTISFPLVSLSSSKAYTANFTLDMKNFGINQTFANEVIELTITVPLI